jgi:hypothetical protein
LCPLCGHDGFVVLKQSNLVRHTLSSAMLLRIDGNDKSFFYPTKKKP